MLIDIPMIFTGSIMYIGEGPAQRFTMIKPCLTCKTESCNFEEVIESFKGVKLPDSPVLDEQGAYFYIKGFRHGVAGQLDTHLHGIGVYDGGYYAGLNGWLKQEIPEAYWKAIRENQF